MCLEMMMAIHHDPIVRSPIHAVFAALLLPAMGSPLVSLVAMWACRSDALTSLGLAGHADKER
jgi:hypothetical protein